MVLRRMNQGLLAASRCLSCSGVDQQVEQHPSLDPNHLRGGGGARALGLAKAWDSLLKDLGICYHHL